jgi:hypothetical protein
MLELLQVLTKDDTLQGRIRRNMARLVALST